jgi:predicted Zn-dependent protease
MRKMLVDPMSGWLGRPGGENDMNGTRVAAVLGALMLLCCGKAPIGSALFGASLEKQGVDVANEIQQQGLLLQDAALNDYLERIGNRVANEAEGGPVDAYHFAVLDMPEPNAFALPSGHIYVSRALLVLLNSEAELAGILGHEIGHVIGRHHVKQVAWDIPLIPLRIVTRITGGLVGLILPGVGGAVSAAGDATSALAHAPYGRGQEREADEIGQKLAAKAGWDPEGISRVMDQLAAEQALHGSDPNRTSFLATHPTSPSRSRRTRELARKLEPGPTDPIAPSRTAFFERLAGLVVGANAAEGVFDGSTFLHPELEFHLEFPGGEGWQYANSPAAVGAGREGPEAAVALEIIADGEDVLGIAQGFDPREGELESPPRAMSVNGLPAAHARVTAGRGRSALRADLWWIAHEERIYQLTYVAHAQDFDALSRSFDTSARSFRPLASGDWAHIREDRLRVLSARRDQTLASIVAELRSGWNLEATAVANALDPAAPLEPGQALKVAVTEAFQRE